MATPEYSRRMNRVLDYIDRHLEQPLELDRLAQIANFSPYHFHRVFSGWVGETLGDYLQRRRLARGAGKLAALPDASVLSIAVSVGFGSGEAFARAFKRQFGCTPTVWRAETPQRWDEQLKAARMKKIDRNLDQPDSNVDQVSGVELIHHDIQFTTEVNMHMQNVRLAELPATKIAYIRKIGPYGAPVGDFWRNVLYPWLLANDLMGRPGYGISHDDPSLTAPDKCRYDAGVEVPDDFVANGQASIAMLPGGRYAIAQFEGTPDTIGAAWTEMFRGWLPGSGMQCDARPIFEYYSRDSIVDPETGIFRCELCLPVCPL